jgi:hypothetical protein
MPSDFTRPELTSAGNHASNVAVAAPIELTFSESIVAGASGSIVITNGATQRYLGRDGELYTRIVGATDTRTIPVGDSQFAVTGNKIVLTLSESLQPGTTYSVVIGASVVQDGAGNLFAGMTHTAQYSFSTTGGTTSGPSAAVNPAMALSDDNGASADDFYVSHAAQTVSGTVSGTLGAGEFIEVSLDNGSSWHTATVSGSSWSCSGTLEPGSGTILARVSDGTLRSSAAAQDYMLDTAAPSVNNMSYFSLDLDAGSDLGSSSTDNLTNVTQPTIRLNVNSSLTGLHVGDVIEIVDTSNGNMVMGCYTIAASDIDYYGSLTGPHYRDIDLDFGGHSLASGDHVLKVRIGDLANNGYTALGASSLTVKIDTAAQALAGATPADADTAVHGNLAKITLQFAEDMAITPATAFRLSDDGSADVQLLDAAADFHYSTGSDKLDIFLEHGLLASTHYTLKAASNITDAAGNILWNNGDTVLGFTTTSSGSIVTDPTVALHADTGASASDGITSDNQIDVGLSPAHSWRYSVDGGASWTWVLNGDTSFTLADGTYAAGQVKVQQVDASNNYSAIQSLGAVTVDTAAPTASIDFGSIDTFFGTGSPVAVTNIALNSTPGDAIVQFTMDGGASWSPATPNAGHDLWALNATVSAGGYVGLRVADAAGNVADTGISGLSGVHTVYVGDGYGALDFVSDSSTVLFGNGGNDLISSASGDFLYVNGGADTDTLRLTGIGSVNGCQWMGKLFNMETVLLAGDVDLILDDSAVVDTIVSNHILTVDGDGGDSIDLGSDVWTLSGDTAVGYLVLEAGGVTLHVGEDIVVLGHYIGQPPAV